MDELYVGFAISDINNLKNKADQLAGLWNGKTEKGEEQAQLMIEISNKCVELVELLREIKD